MTGAPLDARHGKWPTGCARLHFLVSGRPEGAAGGGAIPFHSEGAATAPPNPIGAHVTSERAIMAVRQRAENSCPLKPRRAVGYC